jgi:N,N'-diacetyllegionaminate synthase
MSTDTLGFDKAVSVGGREIGIGVPCVVIAEVGINHNGDMALAFKAIDAAARAGAHGVKFQNYRTRDFVSDHHLMFTYRSQGKEVTESQFDLFSRCELRRDDLSALKARCDERGLLFQSTPTSREGVEDLVAVGAPFLKNGSDYLGDVELVRAMGESGLPTVLSTGMATIAEIDEAVRSFAKTGNTSLILLHCVSSYPAPHDQTNLARLRSLASAFGCPVGFSDHTEGSLAAALSVTFGACLIEKHFTLDHDLPGPDHWFSAIPEEFATLVDSVRAAESMIGTATLGPTASESQARRDYRLSCVAANDLNGGHQLTRTDVAFRRPGTGLPPARVHLLEGRRLASDLKIGHVFGMGDFL